MSKSYRFFFFLFLLFVTVVCTPVRVVSSRETPDVDLSSYQTYNFMDLTLKNDSITNVDSTGIRFLKEAIAREMNQLGYRQADNPDLLVNIGIITEQKVQTRQTDFREAPRYIGQRRYTWKSQEVIVNRYKQGTVSLDLVDAKAGKRIWEGVARGTLTANKNKLRKRINEGISRLFDRFPK